MIAAATPDLGVLSLVAAFLLLAVPVVFSFAFQLGLVRETVTASARMAVQLAFAGVYLTWLFKLDQPLLNFAWLLVMMLVAALTTVQKSMLRIGDILLPVCLSTLVATLAVVLYFNAFVARIGDLFAARYLVVIGGMVLGNSLTGNIISLTQFYQALRDHEERYLFWLGNGATRFEALRPFFREAVTRALRPTIATMATIGLVSLPGMMTGQMLGGSPPMVAIKYQIAIMLAILAAVSLGVVLALLLSLRRSFDPYGSSGRAYSSGDSDKMLPVRVYTGRVNWARCYQGRAWRAGAPALVSLGLSAMAPAALGMPEELVEFLDRHCLECHDPDVRKGELDLEELGFDLGNPEVFARWVRVYDRVESGEMPPEKRERPRGGELAGFTSRLAGALAGEERRVAEAVGRSPQRRLNRFEYENTLRDLLGVPWLEVRDMLPEDGRAHGFRKSGDALDVSHVQMRRYLEAAEFALRAAMAPVSEQPERSTTRFHAWDQREFTSRISLGGPKFRRTFPVVGTELQAELVANGIPRRRDPSPEERRNEEGMVVLVSTYEPTEVRFGGFRAPVSGRYRLVLCAQSVWMAPDFTAVSAGRRPEPVTLYSDTDPRILRKLGSFDAGVEPTVGEFDVFLLAGETIRPDAARLHRSRPPDHLNPLLEPDGMPAVSFRWLEVDGPLTEEWPPESHRLLFGGLPTRDLSGGEPQVEREAAATRRRRGPRFRPPPGVEVVSREPEADVRRLVAAFLDRAYRRPPGAPEVDRFAGLALAALEEGYSFTDSLIAAYTAALSSPAFLYLDAEPVQLDGPALADRLAFFLWNSAPDSELRDLGSGGMLVDSTVLRAQTDRLLDDARSRRFTDAFLDDWLDLRRIAATAPDAELYPDYQLDDLLVESMTTETQEFFRVLIDRDLGASHLVASEFSVLNERLAVHYGLGGINGVEMREVSLPRQGVRGGLLTQASVLKVTANGTTTSPVVRGTWIMSRLLGQPPQPPPPSVPAVEPDIRGATTIRAQLDLHREQESCNACHRSIDPPGFALESFDVMGGWRDCYRAVGVDETVVGIGHDGLVFRFGLGQPVDGSGVLPDGRAFDDVRGLRRHLLEDGAALAENLVRQFVSYGTGAPARFSDRGTVKSIVADTASGGHGVRSLIHGVVQSSLFREK